MSKTVGRLDAESIRRQVQSRVGIELICRTEPIDGEFFKVLRPVDLETGHGFCIALARSPRQATVSLHLDAYAGRLLRLMSQADESGRSALMMLLEAAKSSGLNAYIQINDESPQIAFMGHYLWRSLEIDISKRLTAKLTDDTLHQAVVECASVCLGLALALIPVEELSEYSEESGLPEGAKSRIEVNRYERSPANRAACIAFYGSSCQCCGFNFRDVYGELADGYIEVHHVTPVSRLGENYLINPIEDLVPLCSNCHSAVHRTDPPLSLEDLRSKMKARRSDRD